MANTHFQGDNGIVVIENTTISTPSNISIKGTNQAPKRRNLLSRSLFDEDAQAIKIVDVGASLGYTQHYGPIILFTNKGSDKVSYIAVQHANLKGWLKPDTVNQTYTLTFRINRIENLAGEVVLGMFNSSSRMTITSDTEKKIYSVTGKINQTQFQTNTMNLFIVQITTNNILEKGKQKETLIELEIISFELGDHTDDPLLYMPETLYENSIVTNVQETPLISSNDLTTLGNYRLDGEISLFWQQLEESIEKSYDLYKPSKRELNLTYTLLRR